MATNSKDAIARPAVGSWNTEFYQELRQMASAQLARLPPGKTLQATALVHEVWLRLRDREQRWQSRAHFFGVAAQAMRDILVEQARRKAAAKRGGGQVRVELTESKLVGGAPEDQLLALNEALDQLAAHDPPKAEVVKLRYFIGLNLKETADALELSETTVKRHWTYAKAWLLRELERG
ncbi:MAG TPA: ECF-type sigma factor [Verrucomicrobiae bacterium]|nr:ECF-type sigma factor [Verrucomicrobiae bacterium]